MPAFDELQPASFGGLEFALAGCEVRGGLDEHQHKYPHSPGSQPEKLGRKLYTYEMQIIFSTNLWAYPAGFPETINALRAMFDDEITDSLHIPHIGTVQAYATEWTDTFDPRRMRDGVKSRVVFREDLSELVSPYQLSISYSGIRASMLQTQFEAEAIKDPDLFEALENLGNQIDGLSDQVALQAGQMASKVDSVSSTIKNIDATFTSLTTPEAWPVVRSLHNLGVAVDALGRDQLRRGRETKTFTVPRLMSVTEIATKIYGNSLRAVEILQLNPVNDAFAVPEGTTLKVYAA